MKKIFLLKLITFLSAFLLFQIELIIAKIMLPDYGGSYMVWGSCMVFFQAALLAGYFFSHLILGRLGISKYLVLHLVLLLIPLLFFPGRNLTLSAEPGTKFLAIDVFLQLLLTIGPVFFLLATMSIVTQVWLSCSQLPERTNPYILYSWSNLGSFAALLTYPFVFEYFFDLARQLTIWRISYVLLIALNIAAWFFIARRNEDTRREDKPILPSKANLARCFLLSAGGVILFLAVTNIVTVELAPIPLIWIIPLSIYLITFVLNFKQVPWYPRWIDRHICSLIGVSIILFFLVQQQTIPVLIGVAAAFSLLFFTCMYCQRQLLELRPPDHRHLTGFYLVISLGGFAGGLLTVWVVPMISNLLLEYLLALFIIALTLIPPRNKLKEKSYTILQAGGLVLFIVIIAAWPHIFPRSNFWLICMLTLCTWWIFHYFKNVRYAAALTLFIVIILSSYLERTWTGRNFIYQKRNFYGIYQVYNTGRIRRFRHGATLHGAQIQDPENPANQMLPTSYYGFSSPVSSILGSASFSPRRIAVVGLGAGTLAVYTKQGQIMDFYELDPEVSKIAGSYFTFIANARGEINLLTGDGRLNLKNRPDAKYDVLIIDAFNGDAVPYHLITTEMIGICRQHLNPGGILLFHISNRYFRLERVLSRIAKASNATAVYKLSANEAPNVEEASLWGAFTWDKNTYQKLSQSGWRPEEPSEYSYLRVWTDQYSNVLPVIKYDELLNSLFKW